MDENIEKINLIKKSFELKLSNQYKDALTLLYRALQFDDYSADNVELLAQIGELHILLENNQRALEEFQKALNINPHHTFSQQKCYEILTKMQKYDEAYNVAKEMFDYSKNPTSCYCYLDILIKKSKINEAIETFNSLNEDLKLDSNILYLLSTISDKAKKELLLKKIVDYEQNNEKANIELAKIEYEKGNYDKTLKYCLNIDENNPEALYYMALSQSQKQNYKQAIPLFIKAINLDNNKHDYNLELAKAYIDNLNYEEALITLKKSINYSLSKEEKGDIDEKYFLSGWILFKQNEYSKALLNLGLIKTESAFYQNSQILIQIINLKKFNLASAKKELEKYYQKDNNNPFLLDTLALIYKELSMYKEAISMYKKASEIYPDSIYYKLEIIDLLIDNKEYDEALSIINDFNKKYDNCAHSYNSLTRIRYRQKDYNSALTSINKCIALDNKNPESYYFKGLILNDIENYKQAKEEIFTAIRYNPNIAKYYYQMARSYQGLNDFENALLYSKEAIELNSNEIEYKKQAYNIALSIGDERKISLYKNQLKRSETVLKMER